MPPPALRQKPEQEENAEQEMAQQHPKWREAREGRAGTWDPSPTLQEQNGSGGGAPDKKESSLYLGLITNDFISPILMRKPLMREKLAALKIAHSSCSWL